MRLIGEGGGEQPEERAKGLNAEVWYPAWPFHERDCERERRKGDRLMRTLHLLGSQKCSREGCASAVVELGPAQMSLHLLVSRDAVLPTVQTVYPPDLRACETCRPSGPTPDPLSQNLHFNKTLRGFLCT